MKAVINRYLKKLNIIFGIVAVALAVYMAIAAGNSYCNRQYDNVMEKWDVTSHKMDGYSEINVELPSSDTNGKAIAVESNHFELIAYIGNECVYTLKASNPEFLRSTGYQWSFIRLRETDAGKTLKLKVTIPYKSSDKVVKSIYYGDEIAIYGEICRTNAFRFFTGVFILMIGIVVLAYVYFTPEKRNVDSSMRCFAWFTLSLAVWTLTESPITSLIINYPTADMVIDHYALMFMLITYVMFIRNLFRSKNHIAWDICICISTATMLLRTVLQLLSVYDIESSLWLTHIAIAVFVVTGTVLCIRELIDGNITRWERINIVCILITVLSTIVELILFFIIGKTGVYGMLGFVAYIIITAYEMINRSQATIARAQEAEIYEKMAYTDALTGIRNRMAFISDIKGNSGKKSGFDTIFMIDLNDLKQCNDNYGHEYGDKYIQMVAGAIKNVFANGGRCYRIGGDEFCAIMKCSDISNITNKLSELNDNIKELDRDGFVVKVSAAVGYAMYDDKYDKSLEDTLKRADSMMYRNKQKIKEKKKL